MHNRHTLEFNFETISTPQAVNALVFALSIELLVQLRIHCVQPCDNRLEFENHRDCLLAQLTLCDSSRYTVKVI